MHFRTFENIWSVFFEATLYVTLKQQNGLVKSKTVRKFQFVVICEFGSQLSRQSNNLLVQGHKVLIPSSLYSTFFSLKYVFILYREIKNEFLWKLRLSKMHESYYWYDKIFDLKLEKSKNFKKNFKNFQKYLDEQLRLWAEDNGLAIHQGLQLFDFPTTGRGFIAKKLTQIL